VTVGGARVTVPVAAAPAVRAGLAEVLLRPEWARLGGPLPGRVTAVRYRGADTDYRLETPVGTVEVRERGAPRAGVGAATGWAVERAWLLVGGEAEPSLDGSSSTTATPASALDRSARAGR
jgi:hypothetical protein